MIFFLFLVMQNIYLGAIETSADTLVWAMTELVKNPKAMQKAQLEIRSYVGDKPLVPETEIKNLKYLNMVLKETFRMHPPATLVHATLEDQRLRCSCKDLELRQRMGHRE